MGLALTETREETPELRKFKEGATLYEKKAKKEEMRTEALIEAAVTAACEACMKGIDEKLQAAVNLGVTIGAAAGAEIGAAAAVKAVERERAKFKKQQYDKRFHNTKLLLRHYRALNEHYHNAVFDVQTAEASDEDFSDMMQAMNSTIADEELYVESIKQSCIRTKVIMAHVNKMLDIYQIMCERSHRPDDKKALACAGSVIHSRRRNDSRGNRRKRAYRQEDGLQRHRRVYCRFNNAFVRYRGLGKGLTQTGAKNRAFTRQYELCNTVNCKIVNFRARPPMGKSPWAVFFEDKCPEMGRRGGRRDRHLFWDSELQESGQSENGGVS